MQTLRDLKLTESTLVVFSSDNGPWLIRGLHGGSAGLLRDGKGSTWEGGMREPGIFWWPGTIRPGTVQREVASLMDLLPTIAELAGARVPEDRTLDGRSIVSLLKGQTPPRPAPYFYYDGSTLLAVRKGPWKAHLITRDGYGPNRNSPKTHNPPLLINLEEDPSEAHDVAKDHPDVVADLLAEIDRHRASFQPAPSLLDMDPRPTRPAR